MNAPQPGRWSPQFRGILRLYARVERMEQRRAIQLAIPSVPPEKARRAREYGRYNTRGGKDARRGSPFPEPSMQEATEYGARRILHQTIAGAIKMGYFTREGKGPGCVLVATEKGKAAADALVEWERRRGQRRARTTEAAPRGEAMPKPGSAGRRILEYLANRGAEGATDDEVALGLGLRLGTVGPRRNELAKSGWVAVSGQRRATSSGARAHAWVLTDAARERLGR